MALKSKRLNHKHNIFKLGENKYIFYNYVCEYLKEREREREREREGYIYKYIFLKYICDLKLTLIRLLNKPHIVYFSFLLHTHTYSYLTHTLGFSF
jgi:hypothetical protein